MAWRRDRSDTGGYCGQSTIDSQVLLATRSGNLECREGCTGTIGSMSYYCTDYSLIENWAAGERLILTLYEWMFHILKHREFIHYRKN